MYQVSARREEEKLRCERQENQRMLAEGGSSPRTTFTSWLSNIHLSRVPSSRLPPGVGPSVLKSSRSLRSERPPPPLSLEYYNSRFTGSSVDLVKVEDENGGGGGGGVESVKLRGLTRRGTMYPMRTSVSSSEFAESYYNGTRIKLAVRSFLRVPCHFLNA